MAYGDSVREFHKRCIESDRAWREAVADREYRWRMEDKESERLEMWWVVLWTLSAVAVGYGLSILSGCG